MTIEHPRTRGARSAMLALLLITTACGSNTSAPADLSPSSGGPSMYRPPAFMDDQTFNWSAIAPVDLFGDIGTITRAFIESDRAAYSSYDRNAGYPGFARATRDIQHRHYESDGGTKEYPVPTRLGASTEHNTILSVTPTSDGKVTVVVCRIGYGYDPHDDDHKYHVGWLGAQQLVMINDSPNATSLPRQEGTARYPVNDVFGNWRILEYRDASPGHADLPACQAALPDDAANSGKAFDTPPPKLPQYPGWPQPSSP